MAGLGTTYSIGVHIFDILRYLLSSEVETVTSLFDKPRRVMEETNLSTMRFATGAIVHVNVNEKTPYPHNDFVIYGTKGRITGRGLTRSRAGGQLEVLTAAGKTRVTEALVSRGCRRVRMPRLRMTRRAAGPPRGGACPPPGGRKTKRGGGPS